MEIISRSSRKLKVNVSPSSNVVHEGETARFECNVVGAVGNQMLNYTWNTHYSILKEKRFRLENEGKVMHVLDIRNIDHNRTVTCTATTPVKYSVQGSGRIIVLPSKHVTKQPVTNGHTTTSSGNLGQTTTDQNVSQVQVNETGHESVGIPPITIAGVALMAGAIILLILAIAAVWYVLRKIREETKRESIMNAIDAPRHQPAIPNALYGREGLRPIAIVKAATLDVVYDSPILPRKVARETRSLSEGGYDIPSPPDTPIAKGVPDVVLTSHERLYTPRYQNQMQKQAQLDRSLPSLDISNEVEEADLYENMYQGISEEGVAKGAAWSKNMSNKNLLPSKDDYDHIARSNPGSLNEFAIPRSRSTGSSQYSNLSNQHSYDNLSMTSQCTPRRSVADRSSTENHQSYENRDVTKDRQPLFELCEDPQLRYASIYLNNDNLSDEVPASPSKPKTSYAKIRHIIKVLRTRRGTTNVEIVDC